VRKLPFDVQRDMCFYLTVVAFRNAVERMMLTKGALADPVHVFWGFGSTRSRYWGAGPDDSGLAGSRVPRRPPGGSGAATVELSEPAPASSA
jgi:hypothetical protein